MSDYLTMPGYLPIEQAAMQLGVSYGRVLDYVRERRLTARKVRNCYLIPVEAIETFHAKPHGRIRQRPVAWKRYATSTVFVRRVEAPIRPECVQALTERVARLSASQDHLFAGTMQRLIWITGDMLCVLLIWKSTEASEESLTRDLEAFRCNVADFVTWDQATDETSELVAYT